jgi:hypothetical protein
MFVNYVYATKITQYVRQLVVPPIVILLMRSTNQPTITGVAPCHKNLDTHIIQRHYCIWSIHFVTSRYFWNAYVGGR